MLGYSHDSFWEQTHYTTQLTFEAAAERERKEHNERAWLAWHIAALCKVKKFPDLSRLQSRKLNGRRDPLETQIENLKKWVIATGGTIVTKPRE